MSISVPGTAPLASIGLPVFNGETYLKTAVRSLLDQTFEDFEIIVCDNASTDRTGAIAEDLARLDPRIRYFRNASNVGAARNYNRTFELARGRYFKWLAHDDRLEPEYLARTVAAMEARPELVLSNTRVDVIDELGQRIGSYASVLGAAARASAAERFALFVLRPHTGVDIFGLMRRDALVGSLLHLNFHGADRALLAQLALRGPMLQLAEPLHQIREHTQRYTRMARSARLRASWHDPNVPARRQVPSLSLYSAYHAIVRDEPLSPAERRACRLALLRWWFVNWNSARVAVDLAAVVLPGVVGLAERLKVRLAGASVGHFSGTGCSVDRAETSGDSDASDTHPHGDVR